MPHVILIAEDYADARDYMVIILRSYGFEVFEAADGSEAIKVANQYHPDLIFMDISMPVMDGLQATRLIRSSDSSIAKTPIVAVTAFDKSYQMKAIEAGCNEVMSKPIDFDILDTVIHKYLP